MGYSRKVSDRDECSVITSWRIIVGLLGYGFASLSFGRTASAVFAASTMSAATVCFLILANRKMAGPSAAT